jgi:gluconate 2-dehydrogenase gamma chain
MHESEARRGADRAGLSRRDVIGRGTALGLIVSIPAAGTATVERALAQPTAKAAALTAQQSAVLRALVARLIPADANGPSGVEAGAADYIEKGLAGALKSLSGVYTSALGAIDAYATTTFGAAYTALTADQQDAVLRDVEAGKATGSIAFFQAFKEHALQGMFCDPAYGGNKKFAGWDLINYPGVRMPVPARYQRIGVAVPKMHMSTYADGQYPKARKEAKP